MTIEETKELKNDMERDISRITNNFINRTGLQVYGLQIEVLSLGQISIRAEVIL